MGKIFVDPATEEALVMTEDRMSNTYFYLAKKEFLALWVNPMFTYSVRAEISSVQHSWKRNPEEGNFLFCVCLGIEILTNIVASWKLLK